MNKNLITLQTDSKLTISKTKSLLALKNKLIPKKKNELVDDSWVERLWAWADENDISKEKLPRNKEKLLNLKELYLCDNQITELPKEIGNLMNLAMLDCWSTQITELPKEIGNLTNLAVLSFRDNQITELPKEIGNLTNLICLALSNNPNLILTQEQKEWMNNLERNDCSIYIDDDLLDRIDISEIYISEDEIPF